MHFLKNTKKNTWRYHYQYFDDMIYSSWDIEQNRLKLVIFGHFFPFNPPRPPSPPQKKSQSYDERFLRYGVRLTEFLSFGPFFCPFTSPPPTIQKTKILKKRQKCLGVLSFLQMCTINDNMHGFWDIECNRQNLLSLWTIFCSFTLLWTQKVKILKKRKKRRETLSFYKYVL